MSAPQPPEPANFVTLLHYVERLFAEHQRQHDLMDNASRIAAATLTDRMQSINEFRGQLGDQAKTFVTRDLYEAQNDRVARLETARARADGQVAVFVGAASLVSAMVTAGVIRLLFG